MHDERDQQEGAERAAPLPEPLTLGLVRPALRVETVGILLQLSFDAFGDPLAQVLPRLIPQMLGILIHDLEDTTTEAVAEQLLRAVITAIWAHGDQRIGTDRFAAVVSEYA